MKMNDYIMAFTSHLNEAMNIGENAQLKSCTKKIKHVLICGLGGSGIGGAILADLISPKAKVAISCNKDYSIPNFVDKNTLVIANSYSGNTEETLSALKNCKKRGAEIAIITSGGTLKNIAEKNNYNRLIIPSGHPPRAMFGYSFTVLFYMLFHYEVIDASFKANFKAGVNLLNREKNNIDKIAKNLAQKLYQKTPVIYVANGFEGVAVRFRQQINENSKMLCWHHVIPEMNHNELLGWRTNVNNLAVVFFRNKCDYQRNSVRMDINKNVISKYTENISEVWSKGSSLIENTLYLINIGDWVSWYLSEMNSVDAIEIDVINFLKSELAKIE